MNLLILKLLFYVLHLYEYFKKEISNNSLRYPWVVQLSRMRSLGAACKPNTQLYHSLLQFRANRTGRVSQLESEARAEVGAQLSCPAPPPYPYALLG